MEQLAALGLAIFYLAVVAAGACSALWLLLLLFGEAPEERRGTACENLEEMPYAGQVGAAGVRPASALCERSEEEAA